MCSCSRDCFDGSSINNRIEIDGLMQDCSNSIAYALELLRFYTMPSNLTIHFSICSRQAK